MSGSYDEFLRQSPGGWAQRVGGDGRPADPPPSEMARSTEDGRYRAYGVTPTDELEGCDIGWWLGHDTPQGQEVQYRFVVRIGYVGDEQITLFLTDAMIVIEGRHLRDLRKRLSRRRVTFIQAFHPGFWPKPSEGEPVVEKVRILYPGEVEGER